MEDNYFALRLYDDLVRSGFSVWRYEHDSKRARNFREEYIQELMASDLFLLLDSPAARLSAYVAEEVEEGWKKFASTNHFIVCLRGENGNWRNEFVGLTQLDLIKDLNRITYIPFTKGSKSDVFESDDRYKKGIQELVTHLGSDHIPWASYPWLYDLQKEFFNSVNSLDIPDAEVLLNDFRSANHFWTAGDLEQAEYRFRNLSNLCEKHALISPAMLLGAVYFDQHNIRAANNTYSGITQKFPHDPRAWYGLGLSSFHLRDYQSAVKAFLTALKEADKQASNPRHQEAKGRIIASLVLVRIEQNELTRAKKDIDSLKKEDRSLPETKLIEILLNIKQDNYPAALNLYKSIEYVYESRSNNTAHLNLLLNQIDKSLARHFQQSHVTWDLATKHFEKSAGFEPNNLRLHAELAALYFKQQSLDKMKKTVAKGLGLNPETVEEWYFMGLLHYLNGDPKEAEACSASAKKLGWHTYRELVGKGP